MGSLSVCQIILIVSINVLITQIHGKSLAEIRTTEGLLLKKSSNVTDVNSHEPTRNTTFENHRNSESISQPFAIKLFYEENKGEKRQQEQFFRNLVEQKLSNPFLNYQQDQDHSTRVHEIEEDIRNIKKEALAEPTEEPTSTHSNLSGQLEDGPFWLIVLIYLAAVTVVAIFLCYLQVCLQKIGRVKNDRVKINRPLKRKHSRDDTPSTESLTTPHPFIFPLSVYNSEAGLVSIDTN